MKREELSQLAHDLVLAGANCGHLGSNNVHVLTQGNTVLLRLILICVKLCGERMNQVCQGLIRTRGTLGSSSSGSTALGVAVGVSSSVSSSDFPGLPNFSLGSGMGRHYCTCSSESNIGTSTRRHN